MKKILLIIFILSSLVSNAQQDAQASMYFFNPLNYNPAYAGTRGSLNLTAVVKYFDCLNASKSNDLPEDVLIAEDAASFKLLPRAIIIN